MLAGTTKDEGRPERPEARASPGRLSPSSRDRPALHPGPKGGAEGAPNVLDKRGGSGRGGLPPLAFFTVSRSGPPADGPDGGRGGAARPGRPPADRRGGRPRTRPAAWRRRGPRPPPR